jgi:hypothetical protein
LFIEGVVPGTRTVIAASDAHCPTAVIKAKAWAMVVVQLLLASPNHEHQGACERRQHGLRRDAEQVGVECHIDQGAWQKQPAGTNACDLADRH